MRGKTLASLIKLVVFAVLTTMATAVLAITITNGSTRNGVPYKAQFTDVTGVLPGDDVRIAGVRVGQVKSVGIADDDRTALVGFVVERDVPVTVSMTATVRYRNLVGQRYIALTEAAGPGSRLEKNGLIPLERTRPPLDLTVLFNGFKPLFRGLSPRDVNSLSLEIIRTLQGEGGTVDALLARTASLTNTLADRDAVIGRVVDNLNVVLGTVQQRSRGLDSTILQLQRLVTGLSADRQTISAALDGINGLALSTAQLIEEIRPPLPADLAALSAVTDTLASVKNPNGEPTLREILRRYPAKINAITRTATYGSWFNFWLCDGDARINGQDTPVRIVVDHPACLVGSS